MRPTDPFKDRGTTPGMGLMALSAVLLSFPAAIIGACYLSILHELGAGQGLAIYASLGILFMAALTLVFNRSRS